MVDEETKPRRKAKDNPWYQLATLHGEPSGIHDEIAGKNRATWNRWIASRLSDDVKASLLEKGWTAEEELTPFPDDELRSIEAKIGSSVSADLIDFSDTDFEAAVFAGFAFTEITFAGATFRGHAHFTGATFSGHGSFGSATFRGDAHFDSATFSGSATFDRATFSGSATFDSATFRGHAHFDSATFSILAYFGSATFSGSAHFDSATLSYARFTGATFRSSATFDRATFSGSAYFDSATLRDHARFTGVTFRGDANFTSATFRGYTDFTSATFRGDADFTSATFRGDADFTSATFRGDANFVNAEMKGVTHFENAKFRRPPQFFGAKLHEGTTWRYVSWPAPPEYKEQAGKFVEAYERLKLEMDRLKKHGDELDFFALEQQCQRVLDGPWKGLPIAVYGFVSDYGRSYVRPLLLLAATILIGAFLFAAQLVGFWSPLLRGARQAIGISFINTVSFLGKPLMKSDTVLADVPDWLKAVGTIQTILGIVLLFLFGLGIRNRFRMK